MLESYIFAGGQLRKFTLHALEQLGARKISGSWIVQTLDTPVAVVDDERNNSINYYGRIEGRNPLLKVAVSNSDHQIIVTVFFDSPATRRYNRGEL